MIALLTLAAVITSIVAPSSAGAASNFNLTTSPLPVSITAQPGTTVTAPIKIQNTGTDAVKLNVGLQKFSAYGSEGKPRIETPSPEDEFIKWASFSQNTLIAQPNVFYTVTMTIKVPKTAAFGYYYAVVFSQDTANEKVPAGSRQNKVNGAVATLILLDVPAPGQVKKLEVTSFKVSKKIYQYLPAKFTVAVRNTGNIHVVPTGNIFISRAGSSEFIDTLSVNKEQGNVLPDSNRIFEAEWNDGFPSYVIKRQNGQVLSDNSGKPIQTLDWNLKNASKLRIGKYTASLTLVYNDGKQDVPINAKVSFWVIPWVPILIGLAISILVLFGLYAVFKPIIRRIRGLRKKKEKA